jgi:AcrR family transcriptional regulator
VDAILEAARRLFATEGYTQTGMRQIAELAGVSAGSLYQYFPSKASLFSTLHRRFREELLAELAMEGVRLARGTDLELGAAFADVAVAHYTVDRELARVLVTESRRVDTDRKTLDLDERARRTLGSILQRRGWPAERTTTAVDALLAALEAPIQRLVAARDPAVVEPWFRDLLARSAAAIVARE